jgi:hypothetical protein
VEGEHAAEAETNDEALCFLGEVLGDEERQVLEPAQGGEVARRFSGAAQRRRDDMPARFARQTARAG